jgi:heat shock protein HtpX
MHQNTLKTTALLAGLGGLIVGVSGLLGGGSTNALILGLMLALVMVGGSYWFSDRLALRAANAIVVTAHDEPQLYATVARLAQRADLPMPTVAVCPDPQPNAFATGRGPRHAVVCASRGLLECLPPDEIEAVMAHELMHVRHRDILIGSVAAAIATAISFVANMALWFGMTGGDDEEGASPFGLLATGLLAPVAASLLQMAVSRSREFDADRGAAELIGSGEPLARALQRIEVLASRIPMDVTPTQAHAYIHNPLAEARSGDRSGPDVARLFSTHPPTDERIRRLLAEHPAHPLTT